ncbi:hypothetical protein K402DRAFT_394110 [Aulographum hederae CBS 113979]|uniref:Uncharacterized protein n=1 Tax=Aulographum hederae CBS 113979 TaxID=1176131 RepID=A0A6G1GZ70_9PEZI|nr:hypothetical protein K402DRAFT_394110 [Aulographum hederae CBS 113979]
MDHHKEMVEDATERWWRKRRIVTEALKAALEYPTPDDTDETTQLELETRSIASVASIPSTGSFSDGTPRGPQHFSTPSFSSDPPTPASLSDHDHDQDQSPEQAVPPPTPGGSSWRSPSPASSRPSTPGSWERNTPSSRSLQSSPGIASSRSSLRALPGLGDHNGDYIRFLEHTNTSRPMSIDTSQAGRGLIKGSFKIVEVGRKGRAYWVLGDREERTVEWCLWKEGFEGRRGDLMGRLEPGRDENKRKLRSVFRRGGLEEMEAREYRHVKRLKRMRVRAE